MVAVVRGGLWRFMTVCGGDGSIQWCFLSVRENYECVLFNVSQPRILMAMARDGLLPPFFSDINSHSQVPVKSTIVTGLVAALLAFLMEVSELAGMVSVGTLLAFTVVAISVLILRYIPPNEIPLAPSVMEPFVSASTGYSWSRLEANEDTKAHAGTSHTTIPPTVKEDVPNDPLIAKDTIIAKYVHEGNRRKLIGWAIAVTCLGVFILTFAASNNTIISSIRFALCGVGGTLLLSGFVFLNFMDQDDARHNFGHSGGFICPFVPLLPIACILINSYLLINLGAATWARVSIWLAIGIVVYVFYGRSHSTLKEAVYVPATQVADT
ncbi:hypothetical protein LR48_Vigan10g197100 [Vigna angularis]|uniref:Cationic amino acid transporter C-terminal domain-containing protein n=1 Tax=Phaseolus angularis TaxID=3914 RepID=A0A0L9VMX3_PHAAN|nr:hypothetical protein LR48_Vigan10g197100 [Vigna angularis]